MAIMIPSEISPDIKSNAEKKVFEWFKNSPETEDWYVLHSLGITNHCRVIHGEIDFLVIAPYLGIFALEVKGGRVRRKDGEWLFIDKYGNTGKKKRGPFDQAWEGIFSVRKSLIEKSAELNFNVKSIVFGIGVLFPDIEYQSVGVDEEQWQVFDCNCHDIVKYIHRLSDGAVNNWEKHYGETGGSNFPSFENAKSIAQLLRGDFDRIVTLKTKIDYVEEEFVSLTEEQYKCVDQLEDNKRCLIKGGAGTGKTLLALSSAKKYTAQGEKVGLFCYNRNLADWMKYYLEQTDPSLKPAYVGTLHSYMLHVLTENGLAPSSDRYQEEGFFNKELPLLAAEHHNPMKRFDRLIIDEAQDLMDENYLDFFDICLKKGIDRGAWTMFGDFLNQAIYSKDKSGDRLIENLENRATFVNYKLSQNCRNTRQICEQLKVISNIDKNILKSAVEGPVVEYQKYSSMPEQKKKLAMLLKDIEEKQHVDRTDVVILSPKKREASVINGFDDYSIVDYSLPLTNDFKFSTIHGFKGLESQVVIMTDIDSFKDERLMYVAISRAKTKLYILFDEKVDQQRLELLARGLN